MEVISMSSFTEHVKTLAKLNALALGIMHVSNKYVTSVAAGKNMLKPGGGKYYKWKHGEILYHIYGEGRPLILLHDLLPASSSYEWNEVIDDLSENYTVYTVDLPGCGRSAKKNMTYTNYFYVLFLTSFIKDVVKKKCTIIANGYSSSFAIMTAFAHENLIDRIIAVNPKSINELKRLPDSKSKAASTLVSLPVIGTAVYNINESRENIDLSFTEKYLYNPFRSKARFVDAFYEGAHFHEGNGKYLLASIQGRMMTVDISDALKSVGEKITILYGDKTENAEAVIAGYQKQCPSITAKAVADTRLVPHMERPSDFAAACKSLLE